MANSEPIPSHNPLYVPLSEGDAGTAETIAAMIAIAQVDAVYPWFKSWAVKTNLEALWRLIKQRIEFKADPAAVELVRRPETIRYQLSHSSQPVRMDCDDIAVLIVAWALARGERPAFVTTTTEPPPAGFKHVFAAVMRGEDWLYLDPQETDQPGSLPAHDRIALWKVSADGLVVDR